MWTQITCLANDEQSIPQRWQRVRRCRCHLNVTIFASIWGTDILFESGIVARSCITRG
jgi:hypothetical protein